MKTIAKISDPLFSDPWDRNKVAPLIKGELCIICKDDSNHDKNRFAVIKDLILPEDKKGEVYYMVLYFSRDENYEVEMLTQKSILFIPWEEEDSVNCENFKKTHTEIIEWTNCFRKVEFKNESED